jgi:predicted acetyltransferase
MALNHQPSLLNTMVEMRAVRPDELDAMLAVMCESFGLPFSAARELFYKDPYFDVSRKRVLVLDGVLVSCLTIVEADVWIGCAPVRMGGIAGVATRADQRRHGHASRLLLNTLPLLREFGCALSGLFPYAYEFYRRLGWERAGSQFRLVAAPADLPNFAEARYVREAASGDRADIERLYEEWSRHRSGCWLRDHRRWDYLRMHVKHTALYKRDRAEGYAFYEVREAADTRHLRVMELVAASQSAARGLVGFLAHGDCTELSYTGNLHGLERSGLADGLVREDEVRPPRIEVAPGGMFRVLDLTRCLRALAPNFTAHSAPAGAEVALVMNDPHAGPVPGAASSILRSDGSSVDVVAAGSKLPRDRIEGDERAWAQVLTGHHSMADSLSLNRLRASTEAAAASISPLFPRRELFIPLTDHF